MLGKAGVSYGWNYTTADQQSGLFLAGSIYNITSGTPVFVTKINMTEIASTGSYIGVFTPVAGLAYSILSLVYTDSGRTIVDTNRAPANETFQAVDLSSASAVPLLGGTSMDLIIEELT